jgi:hypothetical protein
MLLKNLYIYEYGTLNPIEVILTRRRGKKNKNGGTEPNRGTLYAYMKCRNEVPVKLLYTNKNVKKEYFS